MYFVNSELFKTEANNYLKNGYFCGDPPGTSEYFKYWNEQAKRCTEGYSVGGVKITGYHYFYLNFCRIKLTQEDNQFEKVSKKKINTGEKVITFPDFWDGDYEYFWIIDIARNGIEEDELLKLELENPPLELDGGNHVIILKRRRAGYSYKNAAMAANKYTFYRNSLTIIGAYETKYLYPRGTMTMTSEYLNFIDSSTAWSKRRLISTREHIKSGFKEVVNGVEIIKGYQSEVTAISFKDKPDAAHPYSQIVYTPNGQEYWSNITVGSKLFDENGGTTTVTQVHERGIKDVYRITFNDGRTVEATEDHKWNVTRKANKRINGKDTKAYKNFTSTTTELLHFINTNTRSTNKLKVNLSQGVEFTAQDVPIDAYTLGLMLGDGCFTKSTNMLSYITMMWSDIDYLQQFVPFQINHCSFDTINRKQNKIAIPNGKNIYKSLGLHDKKSGTKFIPDIYKYNSKEVRFGVLNGLLDTDGSVTWDYGVIEYCSKSEQMADDLLWVAHSLGFGGIKRSRIVKGNVYYRIYIYCSPDEKRLFNLQRKKERIAVKKFNKYALNKSTYIQIDSIELVRQEICKCVTVDNPTHLYLIGDFVQTHNSRGKDAALILLEECGTMSQLKSVYAATLPSVQDGNITTGLLVSYGTGGSMQSGILDFESMFYDPETYNFLSFKNVWDESAVGSCGYFFPDYQNKVGFMDKNGNSDKVNARLYAEGLRDKIKRTSKDPQAIDMHIVERPFCPREGFLQVNSNIFPVAELQAWRNKLLSNAAYKNVGVAGYLMQGDTSIKFNPSNNARPILDFPPKKETDLTGCIVQYQPPFKDGNGEVPSGLYIIVTDPYAHDVTTGVSIGASYVIKRINNFSQPDDMIVASYVGRPASQDAYNENLFMLAEYYNARIGFENDRGNIIDYAKFHKKTKWLIEEVEFIDKSENLHMKKLGRKYGMSMGSKERKGQATIYLRDWLKTPRGKDEDGNVRMNLHFIFDIALIDELVKYNPDGNFDRVSSILCGMYFLKDSYKRELQYAEEEKESFFDRALY